MDHIGNLPISQRFDQGEDAHGALKILQPRQGPNTSERISDAACLVLALNDLTCEEGGVGKFYVFSQSSIHSTYATNKEVYAANHALPDILYIPYVWSVSDREAWKTMTPVLRLELCSARRGWLDPETVVLPIHVSLSMEPSENITMLPYTKAPITMLILPQPYLGRTSEIRSKLERSATTAGYPVYEGKTGDLEPFRITGGPGLIRQGPIDAVTKAYFESQAGDLSTYGAELDKLIEAGEIAKRTGQAYGLREGEEDGE